MKHFCRHGTEATLPTMSDIYTQVSKTEAARRNCCAQIMPDTSWAHKITHYSSLSEPQREVAREEVPQMMSYKLNIQPKIASSNLKMRKQRHRVDKYFAQVHTTEKCVSKPADPVLMPAVWPERLISMGPGWSRTKPLASQHRLCLLPAGGLCS